MENIYLQELIASIERDLEKHKQGKYDGNEVHENCPERMQATINNLKAKANSRISFEPTGDIETVRGDEFDNAVVLAHVADQLECKGKVKEAAKARAGARRLIAAQLNEFDGFCR